MPGIFGDLFDFDGDGKLDCVEQAAELITVEYNKVRNFVKA